MIGAATRHKLHILALARSTPLHGGGGMEVQSWSLMKQWSHLGHRVTCVTTRISRAAPENIDGIRLIELTRAVGRYSRDWWRATPSSVSSLSPDIVFGVSAGAHAVVKAFPEAQNIYMQAHGTAIDELLTKFSLKSPRALAKTPKDILGAYRDFSVYPSYRRVFSIGPAVTHRLRQIPRNWGPAVVTEIPNGVEPVSQADRSLHHPQTPLRLLYIGRLHPEKGVDRALALADHLNAAGKRVSLTIVGDGPERERLHTLAQRKYVRAGAEFKGRLSGSSLTDVLHSSDVCLMPSRRREGLPMVLLEAMEAGLPSVISHNVTPGVPENLRSSLLTSNFSLDDLTLDALQQHAQRRVGLPEDFHADRVAARYLACFYNDLSAI